MISRVLFKFKNKLVDYLKTRMIYELGEDAQRALHLKESDIQKPIQSEELLKLFSIDKHEESLPNTHDIFSLDNKLLPCWLKSDLTPEDDWLTSQNYYPIYYSIYQKLANKLDKPRLLEIGVRTGYMGVVFAKAVQGQSFYLGVDPNIYILNGLDLAGATFRMLRSAINNFDFALLEGYSWDTTIKRSLVHSGPFDIIHIDGEHTLRGKLNDLELARDIVTKSGVILVDDYDHHGIVSDAVLRALTLGWYHEFAYIPTKRGLAVLR